MPLLLFVAGIVSAQLHEGDFLVAGTEVAGGKLQIANFQQQAEIRLSRTLCTPSLCLYSAISPGFIGLSADLAVAGSFPLRPGTPRLP
ncbi:MAG: hypothetical protein N3C12_01990 [Candidatus Binatia bacterium]|nr:hypothetical protein [Candidatus Binatia bacterium]